MTNPNPITTSAATIAAQLGETDPAPRATLSPDILDGPKVAKGKNPAK
jgi:hypothetical protein